MKIYCARDNQSNILDSLVGKPLWILCKFYSSGKVMSKNYYVRLFDKEYRNGNRTYYKMTSFSEDILNSEYLIDYITYFQDAYIAPDDYRIENYAGGDFAENFYPVKPIQIITQEELNEMAFANLNYWIGHGL